MLITNVNIHGLCSKRSEGFNEAESAFLVNSRSPIRALPLLLMTRVAVLKCTGLSMHLLTFRYEVYAAYCNQITGIAFGTNILRYLYHSRAGRRVYVYNKKLEKDQ